VPSHAAAAAAAAASLAARRADEQAEGRVDEWRSDGGSATTRARYLAYQPPAGLGEWFVSLRNAIGIAKALGRTLVVPHLLLEGSISAPAAYSSVYSWPALHAAIPDAIEVDEFLSTQRPTRAPPPPGVTSARTRRDSLDGWADGARGALA